MSILGEKGNRKEKHGEEFAYMSRLGEMTMAENRRELTQDEMDLNTGAMAYQQGDYKTAITYYTKAAEAGNVIALSNLGYCYYYGRSIPVDKVKAKECWERASIFGDIAAVYKLGDMYRNDDLKKNIAYSHALYRRAFEMALESEDIYVCPDAYLRMLRYYPEEIDHYADRQTIAEDCVSMLKKRIEDGDRYSDKLLKEAEDFLQKIHSAAPKDADMTPEFVHGKNIPDSLQVKESFFSDGRSYLAEMWCLEQTTNVTYYFPVDDTMGGKIPNDSGAIEDFLIRQKKLVAGVSHPLGIQIIERYGWRVYSVSVWGGCDDEVFCEAYL